MTEITVATATAMFSALPTFPKLPAFYRCHPTTFYHLAVYLPAATGCAPFGGVRIEQDITVPVGEFWPPETIGGRA